MIQIPEWVIWAWVIIVIAGVPIAYRMGRNSGWKDFSPPPKHFFDHEEDGL